MKKKVIRYISFILCMALMVSNCDFAVMTGKAQEEDQPMQGEITKDSQTTLQDDKEETQESGLAASQGSAMEKTKENGADAAQESGLAASQGSAMEETGENNPDAAQESGPEGMPDSMQEDSPKELREDSEDMESAAVTATGTYTGVAVVEMSSTRCNSSGTVINFVKKSYQNTAGDLTEILNSGPRCLQIAANFTEIAAYVFAGSSNASPNYAKIMGQRIQSNMKEVEFASGSAMNKIGDYAFSNAPVFYAFNGAGADKLTTLGQGVFYNDSSLELIVLPGGVKNVESETFKTGNASTKVIAPKDSTTDKTLQGSYVFSLPGNTYYVYSGIHPEDYVRKTFSLQFGGSNYTKQVYNDGKVIADYSGIPCGSSVKVIIKPQKGYYFKDKLTTNLTESRNKYKVTQRENEYELEFIMTENANVSINTEVEMLSLEVSSKNSTGSGEIAVVTSAGTDRVGTQAWTKSYAYGSSAEIMITPAAHSHIENVIVDGVNKGAISKFALTFDQKHSISVVFGIDKHSLTLIYDASKGTVTGNQSSYAYGSSADLTILPREGYEVRELYINGTKKENASSLRISMTGDTTVQVSFEKKRYQIDTAGENVYFSNDVNGLFEHGNDITFTMTPKDGYRIVKILVDGKNVGTGESYTFVALNSDHTIEVETEILCYEIKVIHDNTAMVVNDCEDKFIYGSKPVFLIETAEGYEIKDLLVDGVSVGARNRYQFMALKEDHVLEVVTEKIKTQDPGEGNEGGNVSGNKPGGGSEDQPGEGGGSGNQPGGGDGNQSGNGDGEQSGGGSGNQPGGGNGNGNGDQSGNGNQPGDENVSGNRPGEGDGDGTGNENGTGGNVSGNGSGSASGNGAGGGNENGNGAGGGNGRYPYGEAYYAYDPDKTKFDVDDAGNKVNHSAQIMNTELNSGGGSLRYGYIIYHSGSSFLLPVPVREGYEFAGWYQGMSQIRSTKEIQNTAVPVLARWTPAIYRITYDLGKGSFKNVSKVPYLYTITKSTTLVKPVRTGYNFAGWYRKGTDIKISKITKGVYYGGTLELEAKWYLKKPTDYFVENKEAKTGGRIIYDFNGGNVQNGGFLIDYYSFMKPTALIKPARTGYKFEGWYVEGTEVRLTKIAKNQYLGDVKLVARWSRAHMTITYVANKGKGSMDKTTMLYDDYAVIKNGNLTRKNYVFTGWNTKANGSGIPYKAGDEVKNITTKSNIKLYAQWQRLY